MRRLALLAMIAAACDHESDGADAGRSLDAAVDDASPAVDAGREDAGTRDGGGASTLAVEIVSPIALETLEELAILPPGTQLNVVVRGDALAVEGAASGGVAPYTFTWQSSADGVVATGATTAISGLSVGEHDLVLVATDSLGASGESTPLAVHVLAPEHDWSHRRRPSAPPASGDWMTPVRNQTTCGSCWAFAALAVIEAQYNIQLGNPDLDLDLSEQTVIDCDTHSVGCSGGGTEQSLTGFLRDVGAPVEGCNPFLGVDDTCLTGCRDGSAPASYRVTGTRWVIAEAGSSNDAVRAWMQYQLTSHGPIARTISGMLDYDPTTHTCTGGMGDHYVAVVGYDHPRRLWIAKNSWGASWNGDGYMEIAYDSCAIDNAAMIVDTVAMP